MGRTLFEAYHPAVPAIYFVGAVAFSMAVFQPVYLGISLVSALAISVYLRGWRAVVRSFAWQLPLCVLVALLNPVFSSRGSTELFRIGTQAVYLEALWYGLCMGIMLVGALAWLSNMFEVLSSDKIMALTGRAFPTIGIMLTMTARLVPLFVGRGHDIGAVQSMNSAAVAAAGSGKDARKSSRLRQLTVLMGWGMEDSLDTADAMKARGWGSTDQRTLYQRQQLRGADYAAIAVLAVLIVANAFLASVAVSQFTFYPVTSTLIPWWGYSIFALCMVGPLLVQGVQWLRWNR